jgi:tRNA pseudouridine32 synthase / 23S rRNA pseudouridine746 synthase
MSVWAAPALSSQFVTTDWLIAQDDRFLIINKPSGLLSVPGRGPERADCASARVQAQFSDALIVHRLDMETSGLMLFARGIDAQRALSRAFEQRQIGKQYLAVVDGLVGPEQGEINLPLIGDWPNRPRQVVDLIRGKPSLTQFSVLARDEIAQQTRVALTPITGRSHQLRVHLTAIGHCILGDSLYAHPAALSAAPRLLLHAQSLRFQHPLTGQALSFSVSAAF